MAAPPPPSAEPARPGDTYIFFIRHGESVANVLKKQGARLEQILVLDPELSAEGAESAQGRGRQLGNRQVYNLEGTYRITHDPTGKVAFGASGLLRAQQTALLLAKSMADSIVDLPVYVALTKSRFIVPPTGGTPYYQNTGLPVTNVRTDIPASLYADKIKAASQKVYILPHISEEGITRDNQPNTRERQEARTNASLRPRRRNVRPASNTEPSDIDRFFAWLGENRSLFAQPDEPLQMFIVTHSHLLKRFMKEQLKGTAYEKKDVEFFNLDGIEVKVRYTYDTGTPTLVEGPVIMSKIDRAGPVRLIEDLQNRLEGILRDLPNTQDYKSFHRDRIAPLEVYRPLLSSLSIDLKLPSAPNYSRFQASRKSQNTAGTSLRAAMNALKEQVDAKIRAQYEASLAALNIETAAIAAPAAANIERAGFAGPERAEKGVAETRARTGAFNQPVKAPGPEAENAVPTPAQMPPAPTSGGARRRRTRRNRKVRKSRRSH